MTLFEKNMIMTLYQKKKNAKNDFNFNLKLNHYFYSFKNIII